MPGQSTSGLVEREAPDGASVSSTEWQVRIGRLVRRERLARGWSQGELARRTGTDQRVVSRVENGASAHPESRVLLAMSVVLVIPRPELADALGMDHFLDLDHHVPDLDEPRIKRMYRHLAKLTTADQWLTISILEQLINRFRAGDGPRRMVHLTAAMLATRVVLDIISDGKLNGLVQFATDLCGRGRGIL